MYVSPWPGLSPAELLGSPASAGRPFPLSAPAAVFFHVARSAIYHLTRALGCGEGGTVLMPDYHSGAEVWAVRAAGAMVRYYHVDRTMGVDLGEIRSLCAARPRVLYLIHYLGWPQPVEEIAALCRESGVVLVEDCALSLLSAAGGRPLGTTGDYAVFCLYKTLPVPNGGLLVKNRGTLDGLGRLALRRPGPLSVSARAAELLVDWVRGRTDGVGEALVRAKRAAGWTLDILGARRLPVADIDPEFSTSGYDVGRTDVGIARLSESLMRRLDYQAIVRARRRNYARLAERLSPRVRPLHGELPDGVCPLFLPLLVPDKHAIATELRARGIGAVEFWNYGYPEARWDEGPDAAFLRRHVLELPIHQRVTPEQVDRMADQVLGLLAR
jgi:dTDP-4-amino-4,6-dideoxygalactose transaminase